MVRATYGLLGCLLAGFLVSLIVRPAGAYSTWLDGWGVDGFEVVLCALAFGRALGRRADRAVPLALGFAMLMWTAGDIALTVESLHGATPPTPSVADIFYLAVLPRCLPRPRAHAAPRVEPARARNMARRRGRRARCGGALCGVRVPEHPPSGRRRPRRRWRPNLAYPVGDVLLLAMAVGGSALISGGAPGRMAPGRARLCASTRSATPSTFVGSRRPSRRHRRRDRLAERRSCSSRWRSGCAARASTSSPTSPRRDSSCRGSGPSRGWRSFCYGSMHQVDPVAVGLAAATLVVVGIRLGLSVGSLRALTEERHRQAVTDQLTGLGNRRRLAAVLESFFADAADPGRRAPPGVPLRRPRPLQGGQRLVRPPCRRPAAHPDRAAARACLGSNDLLVRIGGDELAVVLLDSDARSGGARRRAAGGHPRRPVRARHGERADRREHRHRPRTRPCRDRGRT